MSRNERVRNLPLATNIEFGKTPATELFMFSMEVPHEFRCQVIEQSRDSTLPCNLSDYWLNLLSKQAADLFEGQIEVCPLEIVAALIHVVSAKHHPDNFTVDMSELFGYFDEYRLELALEEVRRHTDLDISPTTLEEIFEERDITISRP